MLRVLVAEPLHRAVEVGDPWAGWQRHEIRGRAGRIEVGFGREGKGKSHGYVLLETVGRSWSKHPELMAPGR